MIYVLDTSTISQVYRSYYRDRFPSFWGLFDALVQEGRARSVSEVEAELSRRYGLEAAIRDLKRLQPGFFALPTPEEQQFIGSIFAIPHFQQLINAKAIAEGTPVADPYLIAKGGHHWRSALWLQRRNLALMQQGFPMSVNTSAWIA